MRTKSMMTVDLTSQDDGIGVRNVMMKLERLESRFRSVNITDKGGG